jgi:hypothetical protein
MSSQDEPIAGPPFGIFMRHEPGRPFDRARALDPSQPPAYEPAGHQGGETPEAHAAQRKNAARAALSGIVPLTLLVIGAARLIGWLTS